MPTRIAVEIYLLQWSHILLDVFSSRPSSMILAIGYNEESPKHSVKSFFLIIMRNQAFEECAFPLMAEVSSSVLHRPTQRILFSPLGLLGDEERRKGRKVSVVS